jgi:phosphoribosylanthranilate isomerase
VSLRIKVCGITRLQDALAAVEAGVDAVGFNFAPASPRRLDPEAARAIAAALPPYVVRVGVFVDAVPVLLEEILRHAGLHVAQLHGDEEPGTCRALRVPWYKAHRVGAGFDPEGIGRYGTGAFLLDTAVEGAAGGTGRTFDWKVARRAAVLGPVILAGGLAPENVAAAVEAARPWAVDVNSGVESAPGVKDAARLAEFVRRARAAAARFEVTA